MSVKSEMTAIADRLRAMLGTSEPLTLDGMSAALDAHKEQVADGFEAVLEMGGTAPSSPIMANMPEAIKSIPKGVTVQTKSGNTSTDSSGKLTISCGFKPDLVMLYFAAGPIEGGTYEAIIALPFKDKNTSYQPASSVLQTDYMVTALPMSVTSTGVTITVKRMAYDFSTTAHANTYVSWKAVKYS